MTEALAARCLLATETSALPVDALRLLRLARATMVFTPEQALAMGVEAEALTALSPQVPAAAYDTVTAEGIRRHIVIWRPGASPARLRMTLAHELGHIALRHHPLPDEHGRLLRHTAPEEREANAFARALLAPPSLLGRLAPRIHSVRALAWLFGLPAPEAGRLFAAFCAGAGPSPASALPASLAAGLAERLLPAAEQRLAVWLKTER